MSSARLTVSRAAEELDCCQHPYNCGWRRAADCGEIDCDRHRHTLSKDLSCKLRPLRKSRFRLRRHRGGGRLVYRVRSHRGSRRQPGWPRGILPLAHGLTPSSAHSGRRGCTTTWCREFCLCTRSGWMCIQRSRNSKGDEFLHAVTRTDQRTGIGERRTVANVFVMNGARPNGEWLRECVDMYARDQ
jgi:hypothetical protein